MSRKDKARKFTGIKLERSWQELRKQQNLDSNKLAAEFLIS